MLVLLLLFCIRLPGNLIGLFAPPIQLTLGHFSMLFLFLKTEKDRSFSLCADCNDEISGEDEWRILKEELLEKSDRLNILGMVGRIRYN